MIKNILTVLSGDLAAKGIGLATTFILAKKLPVENFGVYNYIITLMGLLSITVTPFANTYLRDHRYYQFEKYNFSYIWICLLLSPLFYFVVYSYVYPVQWYVFIVFAINFVLLTSWHSYFNVYEQYRKYTALNVLQSAGIFLALLVLLFAFNAQNLDALIAIAYFVSLIFMACYLFASIRFSNITFKINFLFFKRMYGDSIYLVLYWSILPIMSFIGMYFVEKYISDYELGLYSFSLKIYALSLIGLAPMLTVLRIRQIDVARCNGYYDFFKRNIKKVFLFSSGFYLLSIFGAFIFTYVFFREYKASIVATSILITTSFFSYLTIPFSFLMAFRKYYVVFILSLISLFLCIAINYYLIPRLGIIAAALANLVAHSFLNTTGALMSCKYYGASKDNLTQENS